MSGMVEKIGFRLEQRRFQPLMASAAFAGVQVLRCCCARHMHLAVSGCIRCVAAAGAAKEIGVRMVWEPIK